MPAAARKPFRPFRTDEARKAYLAHYDAVERAWPIGSELRTVETDHGSTFMRISGPADAPPLVLLPGATVNSLCWRHAIEPLSVHFRTYALDAIYDAGRSVPSRPLKEDADLTGWFDGLFDALGLADGVNMMGVSYGAYATAAYLLHAPHRLRKVVWLSPAMTVAPIGKGFLSHLLPSILPARAPLASFARWLMPHVAADPSEFDSLVDELWLARRCYGAMSMPGGRELTDEELGAIEVPVLYVVGDRDGVCDDPRGAVDRLEAAAPRIETMLVPDAAHDVVAVWPPAVSERVTGFLRA